jgi:hypothetical protein
VGGLVAAPDLCTEACTVSVIWRASWSIADVMAKAAAASV